MKKYLSTLKSIIAVVLTLAAAFGIGFYVGRHPSPEVVEVVEQVEEKLDLQLPAEVEKKIVTVDEVEAKILEIGELTTCEGDYSVTRGEDFTRYMLDDIPVPGTTNHVELTCHGIVKAGYELDNISVRVDDVSYTIYVSLPEPQINSNQILWDENMIVEQNNILNPIDFEQYQDLIAEIREEGLKEVLDSGLYERVETNARLLISNFLGCFADYTVEFV